MNIFGYNPDLDNTEKTYLSKGLNATDGPVSLKVKNTNNFPNARFILIGEPSRERSEMVLQSANTPTTLTTSTTEFPHDADDPVYILPYDQMRFWRSITGENGDYQLIQSMPLDWDNETGQTIYNDPDTQPEYFYKVSFYDSISHLGSELSSPIQAIGYQRDSAGAVIFDVAARIKDKDFLTFTIDEWLAIMSDVNDDLITRAKRPYRFLKEALSVDVITADFAFPYPQNIWKIDYVEVNTDNIAYPRKPREVTPVDFRYRQQYNESAADYVRYVAYDDEHDQVLFWPAARTDRIGAFTLHYYRTFVPYTSLSDKLQTPNGLVYKLYMFREYYLQRADDDTKYLTKAKDYDNRYEAEVMKLQREKNIKADGPKSLHPDIKRYRQ